MRLGRDGPSHRFQAAEQCPFAFEPRKDQALSSNDSHLIEVMTRREELFRGRFLHAFRDAVRLPDGSASDREYLVHPGAVMVIPFLPGVQRHSRCQAAQRAQAEFGWDGCTVAAGLGGCDSAPR